MIVVLFPQSDEGDTRDGRGPQQDDRRLVDKLLASEHADVLGDSVPGWSPS